MNITRTQSRLLAAGILASFLLLSAWFLVTKRPDTKKSGATPSVSVSLNSDGGPKVVLGNFERSETKNGKLVWEVKADRGEYITNDNTANLTQVFLTLYKNSGEKVTIASKEAKLYLDGSALKKADLNGDIVVTLDDETTIRTEIATYNKEEDKVTAPGAVNIEGKRYKVKGTGLVAHVRSKEFSLNGRVETRIDPPTKG